jgi:hypothetical protein
METPQDVFEYIVEAMASEGGEEGKGQNAVDPGAASKGEGP